MTKTNFLYPCAVALLAALLGACATEPTASEAHFGDSVRQMVRAQTHDPAAAQNPAEAIDGTDGQQLEAVLEVHRGSVAKPSEVSNDIVINVGG